MPPKSTDIDEQIQSLEAEKAGIEGRTHQGFRDASRRNRIEEQIADLREIARDNGPSSSNTGFRKNDQ